MQNRTQDFSGINTVNLIKTSVSFAVVEVIILPVITA